MSNRGSERARRPGRRKFFQLIGVVVILAVVTVGAIIAQGFDVQQTPLSNASLWVLQSGQGQRYARVNVALAELDSVNQIEKPSSLVQSDSAVLLYSNGDARLAQVNQANPVDLGEDPTAFSKTPDQTIDVQSGGDTVGYLTSPGAVWVSTIQQGTPNQPVQIVRDGADFTADALAVDNGGTMYLYSASDGVVRRYDPIAQKFDNGADSVASPPRGENLQLSVIGDKWVLFNPDARKIWIKGAANPVDAPADTTGQAQLQLPADRADTAYISTTTGLLSVNLGNGQVDTVATASGTPVKPRSFQGTVYAGWLPRTGEQGTLFNTATGQSLALDYNGKTLDDDAEPVFQLNENQMVLNDTKSGWVWRVPDGSLVVSSQDWNLATQIPETNSNVAEVQKVTDPKPPIAVADSFGVRAGKLVTLPVMLNDHDPNEGDVLSVVPSSVTGLPADFGTVSAANNSQMVTIAVPAGASGSSSFSYQITDGSERDGLNSEPVGVSVTVVPVDENTAPQWCADVIEDCTQSWPSPQLEPGGTLDINFLQGWLDQQGDQFFISSVENPSNMGAVSYNPSGRLVYQHNDPALATPTQISLLVRVSDEYGAVTEKTLTITVTPSPVFSLDALVRTTNVDEPLTVDLAPFLHGTSGTARITTASFTKDSTAQVSVIGRTQLLIQSGEPDSLTVATTINDALGDHLSYFRVNVIDPNVGAVATTPIAIYVAPGADASADVFSAVDNPAGLPLLVSNLTVTADPGVALFGDVVESRYIHVRGLTANGLPGRMGVIDYNVSDGSGNANAQVHGQATVYMLPVPPSVAPVAVDDEVTVRVGTQVDIPVLANDSGPAGSTLLVDTQSVPSGCLGDGLAFVTKESMRVLAPATPNDYECTYSIYAQGNSVQRGSASVRIHVIGKQSNNPPVLPTLRSQVLAGESVEIPVPRSGVDADGDTLSLTGVGIPTQGFATVSDTGNSIVYTSVLGQSGSSSFSYSVIDSQGAVAEGTVKVAVLNQTPIPGPITYSDYVEIRPGATNQVVVNPVLNDIDPEGKGLKLVAGSVIPTVDPTTLNGQTQFDSLAKHVTQDDTNAVKITSLAEPGLMEFQYSVKSESGSIAIGYIVVRVIDDIAPDAPTIIDTYLTQQERDTLPAGVDVVSNKVTWSNGNISDLRLSLWGTSAGFAASGSKISGSAPDEGAIVAFALTGKNYAGEDVTSYGFLHIPSSDNFVLTLRADKALQEVKEKESVTFDMRNLVSLPNGRSIEVDAGQVKTMGQRAQATCTSAGGTAITYAAGEGEPWSDGCVVPVRLSGSQGAFTPLLVPVTVIPVNPEPVLSPRKITITPGKAGTQLVDLTEMTKWYGHDNLSGLEYSYDYTQTDFTITQQGQKLSIMARGNATQGAVNTVTIHVSNHPASKPADITLIVGQAPNNAPTGGFITKQCDTTESSCSMSINDIQGSYNPIGGALTFAPFNYDGKNANYDSSSNTVTCGSARLRATPTAIVVTMDGARGANCPNITYQVLNEDDRNGPGTLNFTLRGVPESAGGVRQTAYSESTVVLTISPGAAAATSPALLGYHIYQDGSSNPVDCPVTEAEAPYDKQCDIAGLDPYDGKNDNNRHTYSVKPYNEIGEATTAITVANVYAYRNLQPLSSSVFNKVTPVYRAGLTKPTVGVVSVTVQPVPDASVDYYEITSEGQQPIRVNVGAGGNVVADNVLATPGTNAHLHIRAVGRVAPPIPGPADEASADWYGRVSGGPVISSVETSAPQKSGANWQVAVSFVGQSKFSIINGNMAVVVWKSTQSEPLCSWTESGNVVTPPSGAGIWSQTASVSYSDESNVSGSLTLSGLDSQSGYKTKACYSNGFGLIQKIGPSFATLDDPADGAFTYAVSSTPTGTAWKVALESQSVPAGVVAQFADNTGSPATLSWGPQLVSNQYGVDMDFLVRYCLPDGTSCSPGTQHVALTDANRAWQMKIDRAFLSSATGAELNPQTCQFDASLYFNVAGSGTGSFDAPNWQIAAATYSTGGAFTSMSDDGSGGWYVPSSAGSVSQMQITVKGNFEPSQISGLLGTLQLPAFAASCAP